jgi:ribonuclease-3
MNKLVTLYRKLGYTFQDADLLITALTHRSKSSVHNERLEFLGDALLNFCIAEKLFREHPELHEGQLSRSRANLVNGDILSTLATYFQLQNYLRLGTGELRSGGLLRRSTLANAMEAIIGAIYLDGGMSACQQWIDTWFSSDEVVNASRGVKKDPKTQLQEYAQAKKVKLPQYSVLTQTGKEHNQVFKVQCTLADLNVNAVGKGVNRRRAEQAAAEELLKQLQNNSR